MKGNWKKNKICLKWQKTLSFGSAFQNFLGSTIIAPLKVGVHTTCTHPITTLRFENVKSQAFETKYYGHPKDVHNTIEKVKTYLIEKWTWHSAKVVKAMSFIGDLYCTVLFHKKVLNGWSYWAWMDRKPVKFNFAGRFGTCKVMLFLDDLLLVGLCWQPIILCKLSRCKLFITL